MGELTRGCDLLDIIFTNTEELIRDMEVRGSFCCGDCLILKFKIPRGGSKAKGRIRKANFGLFRDLLERFPWDTLLQKIGPGHLVDIQGSPSPSSRKIHLNKQEIKQKLEEAHLEERGVPD